MITDALRKKWSEGGAGESTGWNPFDVKGIFTKPLRVTRDSAWVSHLPFALGLVEMLRPRVVVELGTHGGDSYCAFCQGMVEAGIDGKCFAVDTWEGDAQSGFYGEEVWRNLRKHHDGRYGAFSKLLRMEFAQARGEFGPGSIDLLHIDGMHSYEAVKKDFELWLPAVVGGAGGGVVLLHDTQERGEGFGVWRLWAELRERFEGFEFLHGHGLGILFPRGVGEGMEAFVAACKEKPAEVRGLFEGLGKRIEAERDLEILRERMARERSIVGRMKRIIRGGAR